MTHEVERFGQGDESFSAADKDGAWGLRWAMEKCACALCISLRAIVGSGDGGLELGTREEDDGMKTVLVTGGSGFIASHAIAQLLKAGYRVRTTVRNLKREADVRALVKAGGADADGLAVFAATLESDAGWREAAEGSTYVLHVASPFPPGVPEHEDELIIPAREGALRVLQAARDAGVERVVLTSSFAAIGYGREPVSRPFDETDWSDVNGAGMTAYAKSKTLAERAAWDWIAAEGGGMELATVNPVGVFGPVLGKDFATSILLVERMMNGGMPGFPKLEFGVVDVRDVAELHLMAMTHPAAKGERFLATAGDFLPLAEMGAILKRRMGTLARRVPTRELPNWMVRLFALKEKAAKQIIPELGRAKNATSAKARRVLGWQPRDVEEALVATAESLVELGLVKR